ncbi:cold-shock protein [Falsihalocynthiibacter sp. SS001]|uniref:cold-shock protein n=1 Tax=Falsihalocynthiibacter sp. SS001 TaxID=3349698 RepID=UPI0036D2874E
MNDNSLIGRIVRGHVKWFDPVKGFGFVVSQNGGPDILLHGNVLRNFGQSSVAELAGIEIEVQDTERGAQAVQVLAIWPPEGRNASEAPSFNLPPATDAPLVPARVKWFDKAKGFGFANVFGYSDDVFVHVEVLRLSGLADLQPGEAVALQVVNGERGQMAASVTSWEAVLASDL